ncbi:MAG: sporulation integral membrane protein YtvI [Clostridia bacterium]|jgi:sporulation integral membrane protein YtvI|nr:sporulation integral membrane protein YtvI [Clostridia bacterium]
MFLRTIINIALILLLLYFLFTIGFSLVLAFLLAFLLEPIIKFFAQKLKIKRIYMSLIICTVFTGVLGILSYFLIAMLATEGPALGSWLLSFTRGLGPNINNLILQYDEIFNNLPPEFQLTFQQTAHSMLTYLQGLLNQMVTFSFNLFKHLPNFLFELIIVFIAMYLLSLRLPDLKAFFLQFFEASDHPRLEIVLQELHKAVFGFIRAQLIISFLEFVFVYIGFLILGISYPAATALVVTFVDFLPVLGTGAVMIPMIIYQYISGNVFLAVGLLIHYVIIIIFRRIIDPKILGNSIGISALAALVSMYLGVKTVGFVGLILGPAVVILFQALMRVKIIKLKVKF